MADLEKRRLWINECIDRIRENPAHSAEFKEILVNILQKTQEINKKPRITEEQDFSEKAERLKRAVYKWPQRGSAE